MSQKKGKVAFPSPFWTPNPDIAIKILPASLSLSSSRALRSGCSSRSGCSGCSGCSGRSVLPWLGFFSFRSGRTSRSGHSFLSCWPCWSRWPGFSRWRRWCRWRSRILLAGRKSESSNKKGYTRPNNEFVFHSNSPPFPQLKQTLRLSIDRSIRISDFDEFGSNSALYQMGLLSTFRQF